MLFELNTEIWNNKKVYGMTGYTIEELIDPMIAVANFMTNFHVTSKLKYFDIRALNHVRNTRAVTVIDK